MRVERTFFFSISITLRCLSIIHIKMFFLYRKTPRKYPLLWMFFIHSLITVLVTNSRNIARLLFSILLNYLLDKVGIKFYICLKCSIYLHVYQEQYWIPRIIWNMCSCLSYVASHSMQYSTCEYYHWIYKLNDITFRVLNYVTYVWMEFVT